MPAFDMIGNKLEIGQLVEIKVPTGFVFGEVMEVNEGGRVHLASKSPEGQVVPTKVRIIVDISLNTTNPNGALAGVIVVQNPEKGAKGRTPGLPS